LAGAARPRTARGTSTFTAVDYGAVRRADGHFAAEVEGPLRLLTPASPSPVRSRRGQGPTRRKASPREPRLATIRRLGAPTPCPLRPRLGGATSRVHEHFEASEQPDLELRKDGPDTSSVATSGDTAASKATNASRNGTSGRRSLTTPTPIPPSRDPAGKRRGAETSEPAGTMTTNPLTLSEAPSVLPSTPTRVFPREVRLGSLPLDSGEGTTKKPAPYPLAGGVVDRAGDPALRPTAEPAV